MKNNVLKTLCVGTLLGAAAVAGLSSCGGDGKEKTIKFYHIVNKDTQVALFNNAKAAFEEENPGWKVDLQYIEKSYSGVLSTIRTDLQTNSQPDLAYCYPDHVVSYLEYGKVCDFNEYMSAEDKAKFVPSYLDGCKAENYGGYAEHGFTTSSYLSVPFVKSTEVLYVNKTALTQLGKTTEDIKTWNDVIELSMQWKQTHEKSIPFAYDSAENHFINWAKQKGYDYTDGSKTGNARYTFNNDNNARMLAGINQLYGNGILTNATASGDYCSNLFKKGIAENGSIFVAGSSAGASYYSLPEGEEAVIVPLPGFTRTEDDTTIHSDVISQGPDLVMLKSKYSNDSERKQKTWEFAKKLLTPEFQSSFAQATGYNPSISATFEQEDYKTFLAGTSLKAESAKVAKDLSESGKFFVSPAFDGSADARKEVGAALNATMTAKCDDFDAALVKAKAELKIAYDDVAKD